ncbi:amine oxidase [Caballeronia hypogeia]|uniref:Amine oxidase n=1 Tax=Caballeronia hypogeia TaxID=1777140 RepID=A0A158DDX2_9BURK|nr:NAD(P)/FAD-dependent oxidoreductase [Caballeronia hypogeia]SAK92017.1 amine oxidase [Caballeronia hypogeia]
MQNARIGILGGGLSGLYAAYLLRQRGIEDVILFEARETLGGRILSASASPSSANEGFGNGIDLGPTWFWPGIQPQLDAVVRELGLNSFAQHEEGDMLVERAHNQPPMRTRGFFNSPASMRLAGGMASLTDALFARLDPSAVIRGEAVRELRQVGAHVDIHSVSVSGHARTTRVSHVFLALPPRLTEATIRFEPALPAAVAQSWRSTATWMAPHAKYVAVYPSPFWRTQGLSGEARSMCGPLGEIHDASSDDGTAALFGFFGVPASVRRTVKDDALRAACRAQLVRLFGPEAAVPQAEFIKDWARDPYTATADDMADSAEHLAGAAAQGPLGVWRGQLTGVASEWSAHFPGYVAGAIEAAQQAVQRFTTQHMPTTN